MYRGDNTIIVAASPIARGQKFNSDISNKNDENLWSDCVYSEATITEVYANHYGASELRDTLQVWLRIHPTSPQPSRA